MLCHAGLDPASRFDSKDWILAFASMTGAWSGYLVVVLGDPARRLRSHVMAVRRVA